MTSKVKSIILILLFSVPTYVSAQFIDIDSLIQVTTETESNLSEVYFEVYEKTKSVDVDTAIYYLHQSVNAAQKENALLNEKRSLWGLAELLGKNSKEEEALVYAHKCIDILPNESYYQCRCFYELGVNYWQLFDYKKFKLYIRKADSLAQFESDKKFLANLAISNGLIHESNQEYGLAIKDYLYSIELGQEIRDSSICAATLYNIAVLYHEMYEFEKSKFYLEKATPYATNLPRIKMYLLLLKSSIFEEEHNYQLALEVSIASSEIAKALGNNELLSRNLEGIALLHLKKNDYEKAEKFINESILLNSNNKKFGLINYTSYAIIKLAQNQCLAADSLLSIAQKHYIHHSSGFDQVKYYQNLVKAKACLGEVDSVYFFLDKALQSQEVFYIDKRANEAIKIEAKYNSRLQRDSINILALQNDKNETSLKNKNIGLFISGIMLALAAFFIALYRRYNKKQKELNTILKNQYNEKQQLFTNIAHEFQTPLSIISGLSKQLLQKEESTTITQEHLSLIIKNSTHLSETTNQVLELSKMENAVVKLSTHFFSIYELMQYVLSEHRILANQKEITLHIPQYPPKDIYIYSDVKKVKTIFNNLLTNAIKYTDLGGNIELSYLITKGNFHQITIKDSGRGISEENISRIFDQYYQTDNKKAEGGFGIGLAICKAYIELLQGEISVKSEVGKGSVFSVKIPKMLPTKVIVNEKIHHFPNENLVKTDQSVLTLLAETEGSVQILIVEDNLDFCTYLAAVLKDDYALTFVHNGVEAMEYLNKNIPNLIITDWMMPSMDGIEFAQRLKESEGLVRLPVLMLTARSMVLDQIKALRIGIDDYLSKPFEEDILKERIRYLLNLASQKQEVYEEIKDEPSAIEEINSMSTKDQKWLIKLESILMPLLSNFDLDMEQISNLMELSVKQVNRKIKLLTGLTAKKYVQELRYWEARRMLEEKEFSSVKAVCLSVGFKDRGNFSRRFKIKFGKYPKEYL